MVTAVAAPLEKLRDVRYANAVKYPETMVTETMGKAHVA
jgi:hypothetical protein